MPLIATCLAAEKAHDTLRIGNWSYRLSFWPAQVSIWCAYSLVPLFFWMSDILKNQDALYMAILRPVSGFVITSAARPLWKRFAKERRSAWTWGLGVVLGNFPLAIIDYFGCLWILQAGDIFFNATQPAALLTGFFALRWGTLAIWTLLYLSAKQLIHNAALRESVSRTELETLRAQIHPHFLFNALNSTIAEAANPQIVRHITQSLADFLRFSLNRRSDTEPLQVELRALENYLQVQKVRFGTNLEYQIDTEPTATACSAPAFLILPLLENALKYGQQTSPLPLRVYVSACIRKKQLCVVVKNTGHWVDPSPANSLRTGILNLQRRLNLIYGDDAALSIDRTEDGILASIKIPVTPPAS